MTGGREHGTKLIGMVPDVSMQCKPSKIFVCMRMLIYGACYGSHAPQFQPKSISNNNAWVLSNVYTGLADLQFFCACMTGRELVNPTETAGFHSHQCNVNFSCTKVSKY